MAEKLNNPVSAIFLARFPAAQEMMIHGIPEEMVAPWPSSPEDAARFRHKRVVLVPDTDKDRGIRSTVALLRACEAEVTVSPVTGEWIGSVFLTSDRLASLMSGLGVDTGTEEAKLITVSADELMSMEIPTRNFLLEPWLRERDLCMIYGWRGLGKTMVGLSIACAVASGKGYLKWTCPRPRRVLYVDGELPAAMLQERLAQVVVAGDFPDPPLGVNLRLMSSDMHENGIPDLSTKEGQNALGKHLEAVDLLVLDNLSTLCRGGMENEADGWQMIQDYLLSLRRKGITVIIIHHAGKGGQQRGTSKREDVLDTVIALRRPADYEPTQGARFEMHYEKARGIAGDDVSPFEVRFTDPPGWEVLGMTEARNNQIRNLHDEGLTQSEIAKELGVHKSTVSRIIRNSGWGH